MNNKAQIISNLEKKLRIQENKYIDAYLSKKGVEFYDGETEYDNTQRFLVNQEIKEGDIPLQTRILRNVLTNIKQPNPTKLSNANDITRFAVYNFLEKLQEPSIKYYPDGDDYFCVVEYLAMKYDKNFPCEKNGFCEEMYHEGADIYRGLKKGAIEDLERAFICRGLPSANYNQEHDRESVSKTMTLSRYEYLNKLAKEFEIDPKADSITHFILQLQGSVCFDSTIYLPCDTMNEFELLNKKYIPNYRSIIDT